MKPCPHCGSRQLRTGPKCPSCSASVEAPLESSDSSYKPSWLVEKDNVDSKKGVGRKRSQQPQEPDIVIPASDIPVVRLHDETYINGQFIETPTEILHPKLFQIPPSHIKGNIPNVGTDSSNLPPLSNPAKDGEEEEEIFAAEFWVQPEEGRQAGINDKATQLTPSSPPRDLITYKSTSKISEPANTFAGTAFTPTDFLDKSVSNSTRYIPSKSKSRSRIWVVALSSLVVIFGSVVYVVGGGKTPELDLPSLRSSSNSSNEAPVTSFGPPIAASSVESSSRSTNQLDASLFPISCSAKRDSITGYAFVVAAEGVEANESIAISTLGNVRDCIDDRVAYLHDERSALRVRIEGLDADRGLVWLRVPAPLPGQPLSLSAQPGVRQVGTYTNGVSAFVDPTPGASAPGAPVLVDNGTMVAIYGDTGTPLDLASACGVLLVC